MITKVSKSGFVVMHQLEEYTSRGLYWSM